MTSKKKSTSKTQPSNKKTVIDPNSNKDRLGQLGVMIPPKNLKPPFYSAPLSTEKIEMIKEKDRQNSVKNTSTKLDLNKIVKVSFPDHQYYKEQTKKTQIVLHHTASGRGVGGDINWWKSDPKRIATCLIIDFEGVIHQLFSSRYWAHHIGLKSRVIREQGFDDYYQRNTILNKGSIGVEIDNWGGLTQSDRGGWYSYTGSLVADENIVKYTNGYRGYYAYERYTDEQIESVRQLLQYWNDFYDIPLDYKESMWNVSDRAIGGEGGVWTHSSYRSDKSDCHPQPELVDMLKSLV